MWFPDGEPWQYRVLDAMPPGIDEAQLERNLAMTPTERLQAVDPGLAQRIQALVGTVDVDLDAPLSADDE